MYVSKIGVLNMRLLKYACNKESGRNRKRSGVVHMDYATMLKGLLLDKGYKSLAIKMWVSRGTEEMRGEGAHTRVKKRLLTVCVLSGFFSSESAPSKSFGVGACSLTPGFLLSTTDAASDNGSGSSENRTLFGSLRPP